MILEPEFLRRFGVGQIMEASSRGENGKLVGLDAAEGRFLCEQTFEK